MFGRCKVCAANEARIADLKSEIEYLRRLTVPSKASNTLTLEELESNAIMDGKTEAIMVERKASPDEPSQEDIDSEAQRLLSGTY